MRILLFLSLFSLALAASPAAAQTEPTIPSQHGKYGVVVGTVRDLDLRPGGHVTLDDGTTLTLPPDSQQMEWTSLPEIGDQVQITFDNQNGQMMLRSVESAVEPGDSGGSGN